MKIERHSEADLGPALAARVADDLRAAIAARTRASIAVPGGTTPAPFLSALATHDLDWGRVTVTLTDERQVPVGHPRSNQSLVTKHLLNGPAAKAAFVPLLTPASGKADGEATIAGRIMPLHVCVLGMGDDMHTASLFPGDPRLAEMLDPDATQLVSPAAPPGAEEPRITLTLRALTSAAHTYLLIKGAAKRAALDQAMADDNTATAPIRVVLDAANAPVVFYAD